MDKYDPSKLAKHARTGASENLYESMPKQDRPALFYRAHTFEVKGPGRRELRDYQYATARLLPMAPKSAPITREIADKLFRGTSGRQRREARLAKKESARMQRHLTARAAREAGTVTDSPT